MKKQTSQFEKAMTSLSRAVFELEGLPQTEDFSSLPGIVGKIADVAGRKINGGEYLKLMVRFAEAVARLHNVVFNREEGVLITLRNEYEKWTPLTQCEFGKGSRSIRHRMKVLLLSLLHKADEVVSAEHEEERAMMGDLLVRATRYYERFRSGYRWESSQFVFCYLHLLTVIATVARRLGGEKGGPLGIKDIVGFAHEDVCWFEMPDTPKKRDEDGCEQFVLRSINEMDKWSMMVCAARPEPFLASLHQLVRCATTCVSRSIVLNPESERRMFSALARLIRRIYLRIDSDIDLVDCVLGHLTVPLGDTSWYSYSKAVCRMRRSVFRCTKWSRGRAKEILPGSIYECTRLMSYACNFEWDRRWDLLLIYQDSLADMWGCARMLAGEDSVQDEA